MHAGTRHAPAAATAAPPAPRCPRSFCSPGTCSCRCKRCLHAGERSREPARVGTQARGNGRLGVATGGGGCASGAALPTACLRPPPAATTLRHRLPAWKHSQYFLRHPLFLQLQPLLWRAPPECRPSDCRAGGGREGGERMGGGLAGVRAAVACRQHAVCRAQQHLEWNCVREQQACTRPWCTSVLTKSHMNTQGNLRHISWTAAHPACDLGPERVWVALQYCLHRGLPRALVRPVVVAVEAVAGVAVAARRKALAVAGGGQDKGWRRGRTRSFRCMCVRGGRACPAAPSSCQCRMARCSKGSARDGPQQTTQQAGGEQQQPSTEGGGSTGSGTTPHPHPRSRSQLEAARVFAVAVPLAARRRTSARRPAARPAAGRRRRRRPRARRRCRRHLGHPREEEGRGRHARPCREGAGGEGARRAGEGQHARRQARRHGCCKRWVQGQRGARSRPSAARHHRRQHRRLLSRRARGRCCGHRCCGHRRCCCCCRHRCCSSCCRRHRRCSGRGPCRAGDAEVCVLCQAGLASRRRSKPIHE